MKSLFWAAMYPTEIGRFCCWGKMGELILGGNWQSMALSGQSITNARILEYQKKQVRYFMEGMNKSRVSDATERARRTRMDKAKYLMTDLDFNKLIIT